MTDQVFLDNLLKNIRITRMIPNAIGIDNRNGALLAQTQAIRFGPVNSHFFAQIHLLQPFFQKIPRFQANFKRAALGICLIAA